MFLVTGRLWNYILSSYFIIVAVRSELLDQDSYNKYRLKIHYLLYKDPKVSANKRSWGLPAVTGVERQRGR